MDKLQVILDATPRLKYLGKSKLLQELKGKGVPRKVVDQYFKESDLKQLFHKPSKKPGKLMYTITAPPKSFQIDVIIFGYSKRKANKGCAYALLLVDILSRRCWLYPMKSQEVNEILQKYKAFLDEVGEDVKSVQHRVVAVTGDNQFVSKAFVDYNSQAGIRVYSDVAKDDHLTGDSDRLGILDRAVRTIKHQLQVRYVEAGVVGDWLKYVPSIVKDYNETKHKRLKMSPDEAWALPEQEQLQRYYREMRYNQELDQKVKSYAAGDRVRVLENKDAFAKGTSPKWSAKVYTVEARDGYRYKVTGLKARFKSNALLEVGEKASDVVVDTRPAKQEKARKRITSKKEGIAVDEAALAGQERARARRDKQDKRTLGQLHLKRGEFIVLDAEGAPDELIRLQVDHPRRRHTKGYVWAGWVTKTSKTKVFLRCLRAKDTKHLKLGDTLQVSKEVESVDNKVHADALLYRGSEIAVPSQTQHSFKLSAAVVEEVSKEYVFT